MNAPIRTPPMPTRQSVATLEAVRNAAGGFDTDAWHVMEERDNALIADEILHGAGSAKFVYDFSVQGTAVTGISVIGARHLASHYGGIKHRLVASIQKSGELFTFTSYPQAGMPMQVQCSIIPELADQQDFYGAIVEITDVKTGNSIQVERRENRFERRRDGTQFERPHFATIAQSKSYRNAVLSLIPQDVQLAWKVEMLRLGKGETITAGVIEQKRAGVLQYSAAKAIPVDRRAIEALTIEQISGLSEAARAGLQQFTASAMALGVLVAQQPAEPTAQLEPPRAAAQTAPQPPREPVAAAAPSAAQKPPAPQPAAAAAGPEPEASYQFISEYGEPEGEPFEDPIAFANAIASRFERTDNREALIENNEDQIQDASAASPQADAILVPLLGGARGKSDPAAAPSGPAPIPVVTSRSGKPDVVAYLRAAEAELAQVADSAGLADWIVRNSPAYGSFWAAGRLRIEQAVTARRAALSGQTPPIDPEAALAHIADGLIADIRACTTVSALDEFAHNAALKSRLARLEREAPEEFARVRAVAEERRAELRGLLPGGDLPEEDS